MVVVSAVLRTLFVSCCVAQVRIDKFTIEVDPQQLPGGTRYFLVKGEAVERFAQVRQQALLAQDLHALCWQRAASCLPGAQVVPHKQCCLHTQCQFCLTPVLPGKWFFTTAVCTTTTGSSQASIANMLLG